jgi:hypothetical protein
VDELRAGVKLLKSEMAPPSRESELLQKTLKPFRSRQAEAGDWLCRGCSFHNFSRRETCLNCRLPVATLANLPAAAVRLPDGRSVVGTDGALDPIAVADLIWWHASLQYSGVVAPYVNDDDIADYSTMTLLAGAAHEVLDELAAPELAMLAWAFGVFSPKGGRMKRLRGESRARRQPENLDVQDGLMLELAERLTSLKMDGLQVWDLSEVAYAFRRNRICHDGLLQVLVFKAQVVARAGALDYRGAAMICSCLADLNYSWIANNGTSASGVLFEKLVLKAGLQASARGAVHVASRPRLQHGSRMRGDLRGTYDQKHAQAAADLQSTGLLALAVAGNIGWNLDRLRWLHDALVVAKPELQRICEVWGKEHENHTRPYDEMSGPAREFVQVGTQLHQTFLSLTPAQRELLFSWGGDRFGGAETVGGRGRNYINWVVAVAIGACRSASRDNARTILESGIGKMHQKVRALAVEAYGEQHVFVEHVTPEGLSIDVAVELPDRQRIAIEVDGPQHFVLHVTRSAPAGAVKRSQRFPQ